MFTNEMMVANFQDKTIPNINLLPIGYVFNGSSVVLSVKHLDTFVCRRHRWKRRRSECSPCFFGEP